MKSDSVQPLQLFLEGLEQLFLFASLASLFLGLGLASPHFGTEISLLALPGF